MTKYAIVTGGSSGLGKSLVQLMADSGYHVFAMSRNIDPIPHERITAIRCDITDESSIQQALGLIRQTTQELDVLANC
ncbi:MAG: SDR family NAD(P)-dependent oxidoreductase, partial [Tissierellia bacterium]|nr:SDR family NAD(P)-dependent oxidoreductase [Tissierellia bacterium]